MHSFGPVVQLWGTYPQNYFQTYAKMFTAALFVTVKQPTCTSVENSPSFMIYPYYGLLWSKSEEKDNWQRKVSKTCCYMKKAGCRTGLIVRSHSCKVKKTPITTMKICYTHSVIISKLLAFFFGSISLLLLTHFPPPVYCFPVSSCSYIAFPFNN